jgi:hypothetical protein
MKNKKIFAIVVVVLALLFAVLAKGIFKTNEAGFF